MRIWLIICDIICWSQWNKTIVRSTMTLILAVGGNMKCIIILTLYLMSLKNSRDKIYLWLSERKNSAKYLMEGNNIVCFSETGW